MRELYLRILAAAFLLAHPCLALADDDECKNHYILREPVSDCLPCPLEVALDPPAAMLAQESKTLVLASESRTVAASPSGRMLRSLAVVRRDASSPGGLDRSWGDCGVARIPIWGGDDRPFAIAAQPDGKILVLGTAPDPREYLVNDSLLEPHYFIAVMRLNDDGTLDQKFGIGGRRVFRVGQQDHGMEFDVNSMASILEVQADGRVLVAYRSRAIPVAMLRPNGSIEVVHASAPYQAPIWLGLEVDIEFVNDKGELFLTSDPDEAVMLDRGRLWQRTGRAFTKSTSN